MKLVLITGLSGAGKTVALHALEDAGFEAIDNLPLAFISAIANPEMQDKKLAIAADIRSRDFTPAHFMETIAQLRQLDGLELQVIYLDCDMDALQRRYTETRRRHPLAYDRAVMDGIREEHALLSRLSDAADMVIDTTDMNVHDLRRFVSGQVGEGRELFITVSSFSFKRGLPRVADMVFDVRFLKNPYYLAELRSFTGRHEKVQAYIEKDGSFPAFFEHVCQLIKPLLPRYLEEGKSYLTLAIGCTGGKHRSVFVAEKLADYLRELNYPVTLQHRDMEDDIPQEGAAP